MTAEILIVGDPSGRRPLADAIEASGYGVALCSSRELNRRVRVSAPPSAIIACIGDVDPDVLLAGLRRTREGASIPVILYGRLGGNLRDLADVLDIGADHFIEEPAMPGEFDHALMQYAGPPRELNHTREFDLDELAPGDEPERTGSVPHVGRATERIGERSRPRGQALGELQRTLGRLSASLAGDDPRSDPELAELGLDGIPDVDLDEADGRLSTDPGDPLGSRRGRTDERSASGRPRPPVEDRSHPPPLEDRPRPALARRDSTVRVPARELSASDDDRSSWDDPDPDLDADLDEDSRADSTRLWSRPDSEGPLRRGREPGGSLIAARSSRAPTPATPATTPGPEETGRLRGSSVLRARRPDRDAVEARPREPDPEQIRERLQALLRPELEPARGTGRYDPHARGTPWPADDFDPSESTMLRRERSEATTRRRSLGEPPAGSTSRSSSTPKPSEATRTVAPRGGPAKSELPWGRGGEPDPRPRGRAPVPTRALEPRLPEPGLAEPRPPEPRVAERVVEPRPKPAPSPTREPRARRPESRASALVRVDPSLRESGQLGADVDVPILLWALHEQRFTGRLRLTRQRIEKQIWLRDGEAVFARSTATSDRLVDGLLRRGVLTRPQYETARRLAAKEPRRAGELLVDAGFLKARELDVLIRDHLARVIDSTFVWTDGAWSTEPGERTDEPLQLEVPIGALILDGIRYRCESSELEDRLTRRASGRGPLVPRLVQAVDEPVESTIAELGDMFRLLPEEQSWLRRFDGRHGLAALLADGADEQALFALLFTLDLGGHVELHERPEPLVSSDRDPTQLDAERILERLRLAREADYFELLGVARDGSRSEIRQAWSELVATFSNDAIERESQRRHARELTELRAALDEARDILVDDAMRSAYLAHLTS